MAKKIKQPVCVICSRNSHNDASLGGNEPFILIPSLMNGIKEWRIFCGECFNKILKALRLNQVEKLDYQNLFNNVDFNIVKRKGISNLVQIDRHGEF